MKCIECGHELKDGAVFYIRCGAMQVKSNTAANEASSTTPMRPAVSNAQGAGGRHNNRNFQPTPRRNPASVAIPIVAVVAVLAAAAALAIFVLNPSSSGQDSDSQSQVAVTTSASTESADSTSASSTSSTSSSASSTSASSASSSKSAASTSSKSSASSSTTNTSNNNGSTTNNSTPTIVEQQPTYNTATDNTYYLSDTSSRYYSRSEVENLSNYDLYYARNEIYARHGRMFNNADLQAYFNSKSWYNPIYTPAQFDSMATPLSDVEQKNAKLMLEVEQSRNSPYV